MHLYLPKTLANLFWAFFKHGNKDSKCDRSIFAAATVAICFFSVSSVHSQGLIQVIDRTQKALILGVTFRADGTPSDSALGFFISADGLAIVPTSLLSTPDTLLFEDYTGGKLKLKKIIAIHPYAGLAMVQMGKWDEQKHGYLLPSNASLSAHGNILIFGDPKQRDDGLYYTRGTNAIFQLFISRGILPGQRLKQSLHGAPVLSESGRFSGIVHHLKATGESVLLPLTLLGDTLWKSVNQNYDEFLNSAQKILYTHQGIADGLLYQSTEHWVESAKAFSSYLKELPGSPDVFALRAISRLNYNNLAGCRDDIEHAFYIDKGSYLAAYANALYHTKNNALSKAEDQLRLSLGSNPSFAFAYLELGKLQLASANIEQAYFSFTKAIESDSLLAEAYYEKARLAQQYSSDQDQALRDMEAAARLDPNLPGVFSLIGTLKINAHDYLNAIRDFNKAINMNPKDGHAYINRGLAWFNVGMKENACKDWESAGKAGMPQAFKLLSRHCSDLRKGFLQNR